MIVDQILELCVQDTSSLTSRNSTEADLRTRNKQWALNGPDASSVGPDVRTVVCQLINLSHIHARMPSVGQIMAVIVADLTSAPASSE